MSTASRAFLVIPISLILFASAGAAFAQDANTSANTFCKPDAEWDYQVKCGEPVYDAVGNLTGKTGGKDCRCEDSTSCDDGGTIIGRCVQSGVCRAITDCRGRAVKLSPEGEKVELKPGTVLSSPLPGTLQNTAPPSLSDTGDVSGGQVPDTNGSLLNQMLEKPTEQKSDLPPSASSFGDFLKQSEAQPGFVDEIGKKFEGLRNYFFPPQKELNNVVPLAGEQVPGKQISFEGPETPGAPYTAQSTFGQPQTTASAEPRWWESAWSSTKEAAGSVGSWFSSLAGNSPETTAELSDGSLAPEALPTVEETNGRDGFVAGGPLSEGSQDMAAAPLRAEAEKAQARADAFRKTQQDVTANTGWGMGFSLDCPGICRTVTDNGVTMPLSTYETQAKAMIYEEEAKAAKLTRLADFFVSGDAIAEKLAQTPLEGRRAELVLKHVDDLLEARSQIVQYDPTYGPEAPADDRALRLATEKQATIERLISGGDLTAAERSFIYPSTMSTNAIDLDSRRQRLMDSNLAHTLIVGRVVTSVYDAVRLTGDPTAQQLQQMAGMTETQISEQKFDAWRNVGVSSALSTAEAYLFFTPGGLALTGTALKAVTPEFVATGIGQGMGLAWNGVKYVAPETASVLRGWAASGGIAGDFVEYNAFRTVEFKPAFASELDAFGTRVVRPYIEQEQAYIAESVAKGIAPDVAEATAYRNLYENIARTDIAAGTRGSEILSAIEQEMAAKNIAVPIVDRAAAPIATAEPAGPLTPGRSPIVYEAPTVRPVELPVAPVLPRVESPSIVPPPGRVAPIAQEEAVLGQELQGLAGATRPIPPASLPPALTPSLPENVVASSRTLLSSFANVPNLARSAVIASLSFNPVVGELVGNIVPALAERTQIASLPARGAGAPTVVPIAPAPTTVPSVANIQPQGRTVASIFGTPNDPTKGSNTMASGQRIDYTHNRGLYVVAHKTLPMGTEVLIRNPANGKTVVAQVGERGPYIAGRELDLFETVAKELGFSIGDKGVIAVEWAVIPNSAKGVTSYKVGRTDLGDLSKNGPLGNTASLTDAGTKYAEAFAPKTVVAANPQQTPILPQPASPAPQATPTSPPGEATAPAPAAPVAPPTVVKTEVVALQEEAAEIETRLDAVGKHITTVQANANALKGIQGSIAGAAEKAKTTGDTLQALTFTKQAVTAGARLVNPIENIAQTAGDTQLLRSAQALARERNTIASDVSNALNTYKTTQSNLALVPYMGLRESVPVLLEKGNALIAQAQRVADATAASLQRQKATLAMQLETTNQKLAVAQQAPTVLAKVEDVVPAVKVPPLPPEEIIVVAEVDDVMTVAADMKGDWPGFAEPEAAAASAPAPAESPVRVVSVTAAPEKPYMPRVVQYAPTVNAPSAPLPTLQARFSNAVRKPEEAQLTSGSGGARPETSPTPEPTVYILTGGTGAGKTTMAGEVLPKLNPSAAIIDDASLGAAGIARSVNDALAAGKVPNVVYVERNPVEAFDATLPIDEFAKSYTESWQAVTGLLENKALQEEGLQITLLDNSRGAGNAVPMTQEAFSTVPRPSLLELKQQLLAKTNEMFEAGTINAERYKALTGTEVPATVAVAPAEPVVPVVSELSPAAPSVPTGPIEAGWVGSQVEGQVAWFKSLPEKFSNVVSDGLAYVRDRIPAIPEPTYQPITPIPTSRSLVPNTAPVGPSSPVTSPLAQTSPTQYVNSQGAISPEVGKVMEFYPWKLLSAPTVRPTPVGNLNAANPPAVIALGEQPIGLLPSPSSIAPPPVRGWTPSPNLNRAAPPSVIEAPAPAPTLPEGYADWYAQTAEQDPLFGTPPARSAGPTPTENMVPLIPQKQVPAPASPPAAAPAVVSEPPTLADISDEFGGYDMAGLPTALKAAELAPLPARVTEPPTLADIPEELGGHDIGALQNVANGIPNAPVATAPAVPTDLSLLQRVQRWMGATDVQVPAVGTGGTVPPAPPVPPAGGGSGGPPGTTPPQTPGTGGPGWGERAWNGTKSTIGSVCGSTATSFLWKTRALTCIGAGLYGLSYLEGGTNSAPPNNKTPDKKTPPAVDGKKTGSGSGESPPADKVTRPPGGTKACGPNDTYASSGCYPPYGTHTTAPPFVNAIHNPNGQIVSQDTYCVTSVSPVVMVVPVPAGTRFPSNCYNSPPGSANPFAQLGQLLGRLFGTPAPTAPTTPTKPPVTPPVATSTPAKLYATLIANPTSVTAGGKSRLIWASVGTSGCELFAPGDFLMATGTRGSTSTLPLATTTPFALHCSAPSGATTTASTTVTVR